MNINFRYRFFFVIAALLLWGAANTQAQTTDPVKRGLQLIELGNPQQAITEMKVAIDASPKSADLHAVYAMALLEVNNLDLAAKEAQAAFDIDRKSVLSRTARGMVYGRQNKVEDALKEFYQALKINDKEIGTYLALSRYYLAIDSTKPAEIMLYRAQAVNEKDVRPYLGLAELYEKQRIPDLAIKQYEEAKKLDPTDLTVMGKLASLYFRTRRYNESVKEWASLLRVDSTYSDAYYQIANIYFLAEQYPNAAAYAERYVMLEPNDIKGNWLLAKSLTESGQYQKALPALEKVASNDSLRALSQNLLARSYFLTKDFPKAVELYNQSKTMDNIDLDYFGRALLLTGDTTQAIAKLRASLVDDTIRKETAIEQTRQTIVSILYAQKKYEEAAQMFIEDAAKKPSASIYSTIAQIYAASGDNNKAIEYYNKALSLDPNSFKVMVLLGQTYAQAQSLNEMKDVFTKVADLAKAANNQDTLGIANGWLGYYYLMNKQYDQSIKSLDQAVKQIDDKSPILTNFYLMLAQAYHSAAKYDKAIDYYKKVLDRDKNNKVAADGLKSLKQAGK